MNTGHACKIDNDEVWRSQVMMHEWKKDASSVSITAVNWNCLRRKSSLFRIKDQSPSAFSTQFFISCSPLSLLLSSFSLTHSLFFLSLSLSLSLSHIPSVLASLYRSLFYSFSSLSFVFTIHISFSLALSPSLIPSLSLTLSSFSLFISLSLTYLQY